MIRDRPGQPAHGRHSVKGQMVFQFLFGAVILFMIVLYVLSVLNTASAAATHDAAADHLQAKALQIANKLARSEGVWIGGVGTFPQTPQVLGLEKEWPELDDLFYGGKISSLLDFCNNAGNDEAMADFLDLERQGYIINISQIDLATGDRSPYRPAGFGLPSNCFSGSSEPPAEVLVGEATRIAVVKPTGLQVVEIIVTVWNL